MQDPTNTKVAQTFDNVNSRELNTQLPLFSDRMTPHSKVREPVIRGNRDRVWRETRYFGVSQSQRLLTKGLLLKRFDRVRDFLQDVLGFSVGERDLTFGLLRFWAYYGQCYPKIADLCGEPGCSESTAHRAIRKLKQMGLAIVVKRYLTPWRRQISNLFLLHKLLLLIARYLAEHGQRFYQQWLQPYLDMPGSQFWHGSTALGGFGTTPRSGSYSTLDSLGAT